MDLFEVELHHLLDGFEAPVAFFGLLTQQLFGNNPFDQHVNALGHAQRHLLESLHGLERGSLSVVG